MSEYSYREEKDSMGTVQVAIDALYGAQTQRAINNFKFSELRMPRAFIRALGLIKQAAAQANAQLGWLKPTIANAVEQAAAAVAAGEYDAHFPVDVFQTGSGTSSNMNANEVIANLAMQKISQKIHPNDDVNMSQSSNDTIPTAIHVSSALLLHEQLLPALRHVVAVIDNKSQEVDGVIKTGRTHLMDAVPITLTQELLGWKEQLQQNESRLQDTCKRLRKIAQGGTAVGTGINAHPGFSECVAKNLSALTQLDFCPAESFFPAISCQDTVVELSGQLRVIATALLKIANDLRWMNSGPLAGLAEIVLPELQPGSSIMPGKVNPVIPEAVAMVAAQVCGNDATVMLAGQAGNFQLNTMLPVIAYNVIQSIELLSAACRLLADKSIASFKVCSENMRFALGRNPILATALNPVIGYDKAAIIAKRAYQEQRTVFDVALEETDLSRAKLESLLDPQKLI